MRSTSPTRRPRRSGGDEPAVSRAWIGWTSAALVAVTLLIYAPVAKHDFVAFDDPQYVSENPRVTSGVTWDNVRWAFTTGAQGNWHPLTWLSHMLDVELFGLDAGAHHLMNVALHALASVLLLLWLAALTRARWPSAMVAALFAVHPLHVESVAWIAERKDVLSACFWWAALLAYAGYARRPSASRYFAALALFAGGLLSKPMVVTLPFVLLLLDVWPLGRRPPGSRLASWWPLVREKLPFFAMTIASSAVTFLVQQRGGAVQSLEALSIGRRIETALTGYQTYLARVFVPRDLAVLYPYPETAPVWQVASAIVVLVALTLAAVRQTATRPWLAVGWFWFLGTLVPVIGLVQIGSQPVADRYTYIPYTGIFIVLVWAARELTARRPVLGRLAAPVGVAVVALLGVLARQQVAYWRDGVTLWTRALEVTERNYRAHSGLGAALSEQGRDAEAAVQYETALALRPTYVEALSNLGGIRADQGDLESASTLLSSALALAPDHVETIGNLALVRTREGRLDDAVALFEHARRLQPESVHVLSGLAFALALAGRLEEAQRHIAEAVRLAPRDVEVRANQGLILGERGDRAAAIAAFREALAIDPRHARSHYGLGAMLADEGRLEEAATELSAATRLDPSLTIAREELDRVLTALGRRR